MKEIIHDIIMAEEMYKNLDNINLQGLFILMYDKIHHKSKKKKNKVMKPPQKFLHLNF